ELLRAPRAARAARSLLHPGAVSGAEKTVEIARPLVGDPLAKARDRRARAQLARLAPRLTGFLDPPQLAEQHGAVRVRGNEVGIRFQELRERVERLLSALGQVVP